MLGSSAACRHGAVLQKLCLSAGLAGLNPGRSCFPPSPACLHHSASTLCLEMEFEASLPEKKSNTLSRDLIDYVRYMIQNHGENYKVSTGCLKARNSSLLALLHGASCHTSLPRTLVCCQLIAKGKQCFEPQPEPVRHRLQPAWSVAVQIRVCCSSDVFSSFVTGNGS